MNNDYEKNFLEKLKQIRKDGLEKTKEKMLEDMKEKITIPPILQEMMKSFGKEDAETKLMIMFALIEGKQIILMEMQKDIAFLKSNPTKN